MQLQFKVLDRADSPLMRDLQAIYDIDHEEVNLIAKAAGAQPMGWKIAHLQKNFIYILAYHGGKPIGYVEFRPFVRKNGKQVIQTFETYTISSMHRKGVGTQLAYALIGFARKRGITLIHRLNQTPSMQALTRKMKDNPRRREKNEKTELFKVNDKGSRSAFRGLLPSSFIRVRKRRKK